MPLRYSLAVADSITDCDSVEQLQHTINQSLRLAAIREFDELEFAEFVDDVCLRVGVAAKSFPPVHPIHLAAALFRESAAGSRDGRGAG